MLTGGGLDRFLKMAKGRKPDRLEKGKPGDVHVYIGDQCFITNKRAILLAEDKAVREEAKRLVSVLKRDGMESISVRQGTDAELQIERGDVDSFEIPNGSEEELVDEIRNMTLQIISLSFKENNKWRLTDGGEPFSATIEDADFLNNISNAEVSFAKNDYLVCAVRERQVRTDNGLRKERTIVRIIKHQPSPSQMRLIP